MHFATQQSEPLHPVCDIDVVSSIKLLISLVMIDDVIYVISLIHIVYST